MRLSVLAAAALVLTLPVVAQAGSFDGIYAGAQLGGAFTSFKETQSSSLFGQSVKDDSFAANGVVGGIFAGYGYTMQNLFIGAEVDATFGNRDYTNTTTDASGTSQTKLKTGTEWGLLVRPGYVINDHALVYGLLGFAQVSLKSTFAPAQTATFNKTETAFRIGAGTEVSISGPLTFRADYTHTILSDITTSDATVGYTAKFSPSEDMFKLGVAYHF
jgi:opacity protein-like surface antigen